MMTMKQNRIAVVMSALVDRIKNANECLEVLTNEYFNQKRANRLIRIESEKQMERVNHAAFRFRKLAKVDNYTDDDNLMQCFNAAMERYCYLSRFFE